MRGSLVVFIVALLAAGCVTTHTYESKVDELNKLREDHDQAAKQTEQQLQHQIDELQRKLSESVAERDRLTKQLDDTTALAGEMKKRLENLGQNMDKLTAERGLLSKSLDDVKARLEELRRQKAAADARAEVFHNLVQKLRGMIDSGQLKVVIRDGRMLIALPNDVLFDSGKALVKPDGQKALAQVAQVLAGIPDRHFIVAGHTDSVPIHTVRYPSNWELSTGRAVEVTKLLVSDGMKPEILAAADTANTIPSPPNDSAEHMAQNRRIEIVLQPNLADLPSLEDLKASRAE